MSDADFPLEAVAKLAKLELNPNDTKLQDDFADIMQLINIVSEYDHDNAATPAPRDTIPHRIDVASALNRRGRNILLANDSVGMKYYAVPLVIDTE